MPQPKSKYWILGFALNDENLYESEKLEDHPDWGYPQVCDFLTDSLVEQIAKFYPGAVCVGDERDGENLSVRIAIKKNRVGDPLEIAGFEPWELLEIAPFKEIYSDDDPREFFKKKK